MKQRRVQYSIRMLLFAGILISTPAFCPSSSKLPNRTKYPLPTPSKKSVPPISFKELQANFSKDNELQKRLASAIFETNFDEFNALIGEGLDADFADTDGERPSIPIFSVLVSDFYEKSYTKKGTPRSEHTYKRLLMLKHLLNHGTNPNAMDKSGTMPLDLANRDEAKILRQYGARHSKLWNQDEAFFWQYVYAPVPLLTKEDTPLP